MCVCMCVCMRLSMCVCTCVRGLAHVCCCCYYVVIAIIHVAVERIIGDIPREKKKEIGN